MTSRPYVIHESADRTKCGEICMYSDGNFSLICALCGAEYFRLEEFILHAYEHIPKPTLIKQEKYSDDDDTTTPAIDDDDLVEKIVMERRLNAEVDSKTFAANGRFSENVKKNDQCIAVDHNVHSSDGNGSDHNSVSSLNTRRPYTRLRARHVQEIKKSLRHITSTAKADKDTTNRKFPLKCRFCEKKLADKRGLNDHENGHTGHTPHQCTICPEAFSGRGALRRHLKVAHPLATTKKPTKQNKLVLDCRFCSKTFTGRRCLADHENVHTGNKPHQCRICSKTFAGTSTLRSHIKLIHTKELLHKCSTCGKGFVRKDRLRLHERDYHPDTKSPEYYSCSKCDEKFAKSWQLEVHRNMHRKHPATCDICNVKFNFRLPFYTHMRMHAVQLRNQNRKLTERKKKQ